MKRFIPVFFILGFFSFLSVDNKEKTLPAVAPTIKKPQEGMKKLYRDYRMPGKYYNPAKEQYV